eukprot:1272964-Rhodomonas_salina.1
MCIRDSFISVPACTLSGRLLSGAEGNGTASASFPLSCALGLEASALPPARDVLHQTRGEGGGGVQFASEEEEEERGRLGRRMEEGRRWDEGRKEGERGGEVATRGSDAPQYRSLGLNGVDESTLESEIEKCIAATTHFRAGGGG